MTNVPVKENVSVPSEAVDASTIVQDPRRNLQTYLQLCKDRTLNQENLNREYSVKALGIVTFAATIFGAGTSWIDSQDVSRFEWVILTLAGLLVCAIAILVFLCIVKPRDWSEPIKLSTHLLDHAQKENSTRFLSGIAKVSRDAIESNQEVLDKRSYSLKWITGLAVAELVFVVLIRILTLS
ncbi:MAG: hypothetical protein OXH34_03985 [Bacteroidetes bacterium]|nr:hypothetical protein [Bacteroidota bacterium]